MDEVFLNPKPDQAERLRQLLETVVAAEAHILATGGKHARRETCVEATRLGDLAIAEWLDYRQWAMSRGPDVLHIGTSEQAERLRQLLDAVAAAEAHIHATCAKHMTGKYPASVENVIEANRLEQKAIADWKAYRQSLMHWVPPASRPDHS